MGIDLLSDFYTDTKTGILRRIEMMYYGRYIIDVFLNGETKEYQGVYYFFPVDSCSTILQNGITHYFPRIGSITYQGLLNNYKRYELILYLKALAELLKEPHTIYLNTPDLALSILFMLEKANLDPRAILTYHGPIIISQSLIPNLINKSNSTMNKVSNIYQIRNLPYPVLYCDIMFYDISKSFFRNPSNYKSEKEQIINRFTYDDVYYPNIGNKIYYGYGDGLSKYTIYDLDKLLKLWKDKEVFWDPENQTIFPMHTIYKLLNMRGYYSDISVQIKDIILYILNKQKNKNNIEQNFELTVTKHELYKLYNLGILLSDSNFNKSHWDQELRNKISFMIYDLLSHKSLSNIFIYKYYETDIIKPPLYIENSIRSILYILLRAIDLGLMDLLQRYGNYLMITANIYNLNIFGSNIVKGHVDITNVLDQYEEENKRDKKILNLECSMSDASLKHETPLSIE
jgi:hypothetical protein